MQSQRWPPRCWSSLSWLARRSQLLGGGQPLLDKSQACVPEARICQVDSDDRAELLRAPGAAGREQLEVARDELVAVHQVAAVGGQREQLPVRVRVDVAGGVDE